MAAPLTPNTRPHSSRSAFLSWLDSWWSDLRVAGRGLRRSPTFSIVTVVTLALGVGGNAAIFAVVTAVLLRPLPYPAASSLVRLWETRPAGSAGGHDTRPQRSQRITAAEILALRPSLTTLTHVSFTAGPSLMTVTGAGPAARLQGMRVAPGYFETLGVTAHLGRTFGAAEEAPGADAVVILGRRAWQTHFNGRPDIIGQAVTLASVLTPNPAATMRQYEIVGVMPEGFDATNSHIEFWVPVAWNPKASGDLIARLAGDTTLAAAQTELGAALRAIRGSGESTRYELEPALDGVVQQIKPALLVLMGASLFVLLIACVNVGNLVLVRMNERRREIALRTALGAGPGRLVHQLAAESVVLAVMSGVTSVLVAFISLRTLRALAVTMPRMDLGVDPGFPRLDEVSLDASALSFVAITTIVASALVGVLPAVAHARPQHTADALRMSASTGMAGFSLLRRGRAHAILVLVEVALAMVLLTGGGLMLHSFARLSRVEPGFDPGNVVTFQVALPPDRYPLPRLKAFADDVVAHLRRVPGVTAAAHGQPPMVRLVDRFGVGRRADQPRPAGNEAPVVRLASADYFRTMRIAIKRGRSFSSEDGEHSARVLLINEALAQREFGQENPIGARIFIGPDDEPWEVVGVTADVRQYRFDQAPTAQVFALPTQWPSDNIFPLGPYFAVRTETDHRELLRHLRGIATALEPDAGLFNVATMDRIVSNGMSRPRSYAVLLGTFAALAAVLAFVGIYGVMAYTVSQRTREIGIRMALGAAPSRVLRMVLTQSLSIAAGGIVIGLALAAGLSRSLSGLLFGIEPLDSPTFAAVTAAFVVVLGVAAWLPSRRATKIVPAIALRDPIA
jgi:putative ABC transport system permease protein